MATSIITDFDSIYLTSHLPEEVSFETDAASLKIDVYVNNKKVFTSDYYPFNEEVTIRDIRSIVEAAMISQRLTMTTLKIVATEPVIQQSNVTYDEDGNIYVNFDEQQEDPITKTIDNIKVVFCQFKTPKGSEGFLNNCFLTTRHSVLLPRIGQMMLANYSRAYAQGSNEALIYYEHYAIPGIVFTYKTTWSKIQTFSEKIVTTELTHDYFKKIVDQAKNTKCKVLAVEQLINTLGSQQQGIGVFRGGVEVVALVDVFPFHHEVAHEQVHESGLGCKVNAQVERLEVDARQVVLGFGCNVVAHAGVKIVVLGVHAGIFAVHAQHREQVVACIGCHAVSHVGGILYHVNEVATVGHLHFEREGELHVVFHAQVAAVCIAVLGGEHHVQLVQVMLPAELEGVVAVVAHPETALGEVLVHVGTEVSGLRPVSFPAANLEVQHVAFTQFPLVVHPVEVGENLVVVLAINLVAEFRRENAEHDEPVKVLALVLAAHVGADPAAAEIVVLVGDGLGNLGLHVALEAELAVDSECGGGKPHGQECCRNL